ncbi:MAG TPA: hypothetical protein VH085_09980 [Nocardioides sp.]|jgi:hypothetical protein|nr:hypothetical protein [Nocardioides sp.]
MTLSRITSTFAAVALGGVVVASTYGATAAGSSSAPERGGGHQSRVAVADHFRAPVTHKYGANGMRLGLHCETSDMS